MGHGDLSFRTAVGDIVSLACCCHLCTVMRHITTFRSSTDRIYDGGPIRLYYNTGCPTNEDIATKFEQEYILFFHISYTMR